MRRLTNITDNIKLDLGCGAFKREGFIGMDKREFEQEILWDINEGIPLMNETVSEIYSSHFVEHLREHEIYNFITEMMRVCKNDAKVQLICPHADVPEAYYIHHYTRWNEARIQGICSEFRKRLILVGTETEGINFIMNLIIKK